jgi:hypothetical protein
MAAGEWLFLVNAQEADNPAHTANSAIANVFDPDAVGCTTGTTRSRTANPLRV